MPVHGGDPATVLAALAAAAVVVFLFALALALRSRADHVPRPRRRSFEHGRRLAAEARVGSTAAALDAIGRSAIGGVVEAHADDAFAEIAIERKRNQPCVQVAGFLSGIFESAWAHEVVVRHEECAGARGGVCRYALAKGAIVTGAPAEGSPTPGSGAALRRSAQARGGAG